MAFEKAKVLKAAEKFLSQGKINAAIKEYRQIIEHDDSDLTTLNMLGDLCVRSKLNDEAIACFARIAEHYREKEFHLKAIAMYKKIERLTPRDPAIAFKLGNLYALQGLVADAKSQFLVVADAYTRAGRTKQTLEVLHKIADLDPHNTEIRLKLAAGYLKEGLNEEAAAAFSEAATRLFETGNFEKSLQAYQQTLELFPNNERALKGVVSAHVSLGEADQAAELLERLVADRPGDPELVLMLARAYLDAENPQGAERATEILFKQDPANYTKLIEVARLYLKTGEVNDGTRVLAGIIEQLLAGREENDLLELLNEALARNPEHVEALRLLVRVYWWQRDMENLRSALERLAEAAEAAGLVEDERYALTQLMRLTADDRYSERLIALGGSPDDAGASDSFGSAAALDEIQSFDNFAITGQDNETFGVAEEPAPVEFEFNSVAEQPPADPSASFADLNDDHEETDVFASPVEEPVAAAPEDEAARRQATLMQELESVDFYINQGYDDIANDTLELMERQFGQHPEIATRRLKLKAKLDSASQSESFDFGSVEELVDAAPVVPEADFAFAGNSGNGSNGHGSVEIQADVKGIDAGLAEIFEEFRQAAEEEPEAKEDFETHYNMGTAYKEMDLLDEAIMEFQTAASLTVPTDGTSRYLQCCNMLGHCFMRKDLPRAAVLWFKKGLDAPGQGEEECKALRYELGAAYEHMGDLSRASDLFTEVYGMDVAYRGVGERLQELEQKKVHKKRKK